MTKEGDNPTWKNKKLYFMNFPNVVVVFGITLLLIGSTIIIAPVHTGVASPIGSRDIVWDVQLNLSEEDENTNDYVYFGEAPDAWGGPPPDSYDVPKPPSPIPPHIYAWFNDNLAEPYNILLKDCREYNNTEYKEWNLSVQWLDYNWRTINVNISWDPDDVDDSEYDSVILYNINNSVEVDMLVDSYYEFSCPAWIPQDFTINCSVSVNQPPVAGFTFEPTEPTTSDLIYFNSTSSDPDGSIVNWTWDFDDGSSPVYGENVTHQYADNGVYAVNLTVTDDDGATDTYTQTVNVSNEPPVADFTFEPSDPSTSDIIYFNSTSYDPDGSIVNWTWDLNDGNVSYGEFVTHQYVDDGIYTVNLTVTDDDSATGFAERTATVGNQPPVAVNDTATTPEDTPVVIDVLDNDYDPDGEIDLTTVDIVDDASHGGTSVNSTTGEVTYTPDPDYHGSDSFAYTVDDDDGAMSNEATVSISVTGVNDPPVFSSETPTNRSTGVSISTSSLSVIIEDPDGDSFNWSIQTSPDIGNSSGNGTNNGSKSCDISGLAYSTTYTWFVSATDGKGWTNESYSFTTESEPGGGGPGGGGTENQNPVADADGPYSGFINEEITFDGSESTDDGSITDYTWNFGDGNIGYDEMTTHIYIKAGTYTVTLTVTDNEEATDTDETTAEISQPNIPPTAPEVNGTQEGTINTEYTYTAVSTDEDNDTIQYHFDWDDGTTNTTAFLPNGTVATQTHTWTAAGKYTITVQAYDNQTPSDTTSYVVLIDAHIVDDIGYITDDDADGTYDTFHDTGIETYLEQDDDKYLIDNDGDGEWDYVYDPETEELTEYEAEPTPHKEDYTGIILLGLLIIIITIIFVYMVMKKKKPEPPKKNKK